MSNRHGAALSLLALLTLATASPVAVARDPPASPQVELTGFAAFPADSFTAGPPSGQYTDQGRRLPAPRFAAQPVQGISSVQPGPEPGTWWALSDNGFGARANSFDYRLALYLFAAAPGSGPRGGKAGGTYDGRHHPVGRTGRGFDQSLGTGSNGDVGAGQRLAQGAVECRIADDR